MLQAGTVKTKKPKKGEKKAPRAKSAYLFFQADKRPALKGVLMACPQHGCHALAQATDHYIGQTPINMCKQAPGVVS